MEHMSPLIGVLVIGLGLAFVLGTAAQRLKLPPLPLQRSPMAAATTTVGKWG